MVFLFILQATAIHIPFVYINIMEERLVNRKENRPELEAFTKNEPFTEEKWPLKTNLPKSKEIKPDNQ